MAIAAIIQNRKVLNRIIFDVRVMVLRFFVNFSQKSNRTMNPMEPNKDRIRIVEVIRELSAKELMESPKRLNPAVQNAETL